MKKIIKLALILSIYSLAFNYSFGQEACIVSSPSVDLSYFDLSTAGNHPDYKLKLYFNIVRKDDADGDGQGEGGYDPTRIPNLISIIDNAFNPIGIHFEYDCSTNYLDDTHFVTYGADNLHFCDWDNVQMHEDGIDIFIITGFTNTITSFSGRANAIPGQFIVLKGGSGTEDRNTQIENNNIVHELGHIFGLLHMFHGSTQNPELWDHIEFDDCISDPYNVPCRNGSLCVWSESSVNCISGIEEYDVNECAEYYTDENDNNSDIAGDYIPDTPPSHKKIELKGTIDCENTSEFVFNDPSSNKPFYPLIAPPNAYYDDDTGEWVNLYEPDITNYMSYNPYTDCMDHFTPNQVTVMKNHIASHPVLQPFKVTVSPEEVCECTYDDVIKITGFRTWSSIIEEYNLDANNMTNQQIIIENNSSINFDVDYNFFGTRFNIMESSHIRLNMFKNLLLNDVHMSGCGKMWSTFVIDFGATISIVNNSLIEDSKFGLNTVGKAYINVENSVFNNNETSISLFDAEVFGYSSNTFMSLVNCTFTSDDNFSNISSSNEERPKAGIENHSQRHLYIKPEDEGYVRFNRLANGVITREDRVSIYSCDFQDIRSESISGSNSTDMYGSSGWAIKIEEANYNSNSKIVDCSFSEVDKAIGQKWGGLEVYKNNINGVKYGVFGNRLNSIKIYNDNYIYAEQVGIKLVNSPNYITGFNSIYDNKIVLDSDNDESKGIEIDGAYPLFIYYNTLEIASNEAGIYLNDVKNVIVDNNTLTMVGNPFRQVDGIKVDGSDNVIISDNLLYDYAGSCVGINTTSSNGVYSCNYTNDFNKGIQFWSNCGGTEFKGNVSTDDDSGLVLGTDGIGLTSGASWIGVQGSDNDNKGNGNRWYGTNDTKAHNSGTNDILGLSKFYVNASQQNNEYIPDLISAVSQAWFENSPGYINLDDCADVPGSNVIHKCSDMISKILAIEVMDSVDNCQKLVWQYKYIKELIEMKKKGLLSPDCLIWLNSQTNNILVKIANVNLAIGNIEEMDTYLYVLINDIYTYTTRLDSLYEVGEEGTSEWYRITGLYENKLNEYTVELEKEKQKDKTSIDSVKNVINAITVVDSCLQKILDIYNIKLTLIANDTLIESDMTKIRDIAESCPNGLGESVFVARGLISIYENKTYPGMEECIFDNVNPRSDKSLESKISKLKIYPNPATVGVTFLFNLKDNESGRLNIIDMQGKVIDGFVIDNEVLQYDTSMLKDGIYFIEFISNTGKEEVHKLSIIK